MKKAQIDILHSAEKLDIQHPILESAPKTPQQHFLMTYLALQFLNNNQQIPILPTLINNEDGSFSKLLLKIKYMKKCMDKGALLDNPKFNILKMLILWMTELQKVQSNPKPSYVYSALLPHPQQLDLNQYQQLIVYFNYIGSDLQKLMKKANEVDADDLLELLQILLPRVYYNVIISLQSLGVESDKNEDVLFYNQSLEYVVRTNLNYRSLCKAAIRLLLTLALKPNQMREMLERACRYYLLFHKDNKTSTQIFLSAFQKATEAAKFSLTDELVLFFKVITKLGDLHLEKIVRKKSEWLDNLLSRYGQSSIVGHPKGQVNPFNSLRINQSVYVGPGKTTFFNIQIFYEYSLLYFKANIQNHDVTVKIYYLGDFQSKVEVKKNVISQQKVSVQFRSAFISAKKGIYMVEFDNTYSWINGKNIQFQYIVLAQHKQQHQQSTWMKNLFEIKHQKKPQHKTVQATQSRKEFNEPRQQLQKKEQEQTYREQQEQKQQAQLKQEQRPKQQKIDYESYQQSDEAQPKQSPSHQQKAQLQVQEVKVKQQQTTVKEQQQKQQVNHQYAQDKGQQAQQQQIKQIQQQGAKQDIYIEFTQQQEVVIQSQPSVVTQQIPLQINPVQVHQEVEEQKPRAIESANEIREIVQIKSSNSIRSQQNQSEKIEWGQANLSLIDSIFSLLVNQVDHTYEFQTNLEDRIIKRLKSYCEGQDKLSWIFNSQARDWLKRHGFSMQTKNGITILHTQQSQSNSRVHNAKD